VPPGIGGAAEIGGDAAAIAGLGEETGDRRPAAATLRSSIQVSELCGSMGTTRASQYVTLLHLSDAGGPAMADNEQAVIVHFAYGSTDLSDLYELAGELEEAIEVAAVGEFDGHEIAVDGSDGSFYMYGPDADKLFQVAQPILEASDFMGGATVTVRYGPHVYEVPERQIRIGSGTQSIQ
jgi:hypothetical protein